MNYSLISADVSLTLMVMDSNGDYAPTNVAVYTYYVLAPVTFAENLADNTHNLMVQIYNEHYQAFKLKEPDDPNYIAVVGVEPKILTPDEYSEKPWLNTGKPIWESSHCIFIEENSFRNVDPNVFGNLLGLA